MASPTLHGSVPGELPPPGPGVGKGLVSGGAHGCNAVAPGDGNDTVSVGGTHDVVLLGTGTGMVSGTQGMAFITTGGGNDTVVLGGSGSTVWAGGGGSTLAGGTGGDTFVLPGAGGGFDAIPGFTESSGDVPDLRGALAGTTWNHSASTLGNDLKATDGGGSTNLAIVPKAGGSAATVATPGGTGHGLSDLVSPHPLLAT